MFKQLSYSIIREFRGGTPAKIYLIQGAIPKVLKTCTSHESNGIPQLKEQIHTLDLMTKHPHLKSIFPKIYSHSITENKIEIVMEYIGPSVASMLSESNILIKDFIIKYKSLFNKMSQGYLEKVTTLNKNKQIEIFNSYCTNRILPRIKKAQIENPKLTEWFEKDSFIINGQTYPNVLKKIITITKNPTAEDHLKFLPPYLVQSIHRDTNAENILVNNQGNLILIDPIGIEEKDGSIKQQDLSLDIAKTCFGFAGYSDIISNNAKLKIEFTNNEIEFSSKTNFNTVDSILELFQTTPSGFPEDSYLYKRIVFNTVCNFLADLVYRQTFEHKILNLLQASVVAKRYSLFLKNEEAMP